MTAHTAATALAAGVETTPTALGPQNATQRCIRRPGTSWTSCRCSQCAGLRARVLKLHRAGYQVLPDAAAARRRLEGWLEDGWTGATIGSAMGVTPMAGRLLLGRHRAGRAMSSTTVRRILAAKDPKSGIIRALGTQRRVQALSWLGWGLDELWVETGVARASLSRVRTGQSPTVTLATHNAVAAVYARLQNTPGPAKQAAADARKKGYAPPAAWDDDTIDDPAATAEGVIEQKRQPVPAHVGDEVLERIAALVRAGLNDREIGYAVGRKASAIQKLRSRYDIRRAS